MSDPSSPELKIATIKKGDEPAFALVLVDETKFLEAHMRDLEDADQCGYVRGWCEGRRSKVRDPWQWAAWLIFCALCTVCAYFVGAGR